MTKRPASYDIDQHTYEEKEKTGSHLPLQTEGQHMNGRKIFKIARKTDTPHQQSAGKIDLKIEGFSDNKAKQGQNDKTKDTKIPSNPFQFDMFKQSQGVGLFSNIFSNSSPSTNQPQLEKPAPKETPKNQVPSKPSFGFNLSQGKSLFSASAGSGSLFSSSNGILFNSSANSFSTGNLFGNGKIVGPITAPPEEDEGDSEQLQKDQQMEIDPKKSILKYDYGQQITIIQRIQATKYKKDKGDLLEGIQIVISHDSTKKLHYLVARLAATKNVIFTGLLLPFKSKVLVNGDNLDILVFSIVKGQSIESHRIKVQIKTQNNEKDQFINNIKKIIQAKQACE